MIKIYIKWRQNWNKIYLIEKRIKDFYIHSIINNHINDLDNWVRVKIHYYKRRKVFKDHICRIVLIKKNFNFNNF